MGPLRVIRKPTKEYRRNWDRIYRPGREPLPKRVDPIAKRIEKAPEYLDKDYGIRAAGYGWPGWVFEDKDLRR